MEHSRQWRPQLFSLLGAGFADDEHLQDGLHLRWSSDPRLGLPMDGPLGQTGLYRIHVLSDEFPCLNELDLFSPNTHPSFPVHSTEDLAGVSGMEGAPGQGSRFFKRTDPELNTLIFQYFFIRQWLSIHEFSDEQRNLLAYLDGLLSDFRPELRDANWEFEFGEVCAVDMRCLLTGPGTGEHAWLQGFDRHGNLLAEDWFGRPLGAPVKTIARLRSPNIHTIRIRQEPGMPFVLVNETRWIFCDEFCRAELWQDPGIERFYRADPAVYTEDQMREFFFAPFKVKRNWPQAAELILVNLALNPLVNELSLLPDTHLMSHLSAGLEFDDPNADPPFPDLQLPFLSTLIQAATDSALANILGLYSWNPDLLPAERDYKVEAYLPFFNKKNLFQLRDQLLALAAAQGLPFTGLPLEELSGLPAGLDFDSFQRSTSLCGLLLCPKVDKKPLPFHPDPFTTHVTSIDLPSQDQPGVANIYASARLRFDEPPFTTVPYLHPVCYEVERRLTGTAFANVSDLDGDLDELDGLGILPAVTLPAVPEGEDFWEVRDDFLLPQAVEDSVQYRLTAFDIFGRRSVPNPGAFVDISIPCYEPLAATSLTAQLFRAGDALTLGLYFAVSGTSPPLRAVPRRIEFVIYPVSPIALGPAEDVTWTGDILARSFVINYLPDGSFPDETQLSAGCLSLSWTGDQLNRTPVPAGSCDDDFPLDLAPPSLTVPGSPLLDEVDAGYRLHYLEAQIVDTSALFPGPHRWCIRARIVGDCDSGAVVVGKDVSTAVIYNLPAPPPQVVQPPLVAIPESTYPDRGGDAYYNLDLSAFIPAALADAEPLVNVYSALLSQLTPDPELVVDGDFFAPNGDTLAQTLGRTARPRFQRINETPVVFRPAERFYPIHVRGDLEQYHVVGVVGCNAQLDEKDWRQAGILLFKTPRPVPAPPFRFVSVRPAVSGAEVHVTLDYHADFAAEVAPGMPPPRAQIMRRDLSSGALRFAGETTGVWDEAGGYHFQFVDTQAHQWRRYRYEASLLMHAQKLDEIVRGPQTALCTILAPETGVSSPFLESEPPSAVDVGGALQLSFTFIAGEFNFSLSKSLADNTLVRRPGRLYEGSVQGIPGVTLEIDRAAGHYILSIPDADVQPGRYTLRLWQGQRPAWSQRLEVGS